MYKYSSYCKQKFNIVLFIVGVNKKSFNLESLRSMLLFDIYSMIYTPYIAQYYTSIKVLKHNDQLYINMYISKQRRDVFFLDHTKQKAALAFIHKQIIFIGEGKLFKTRSLLCE